MSTAQPSDQQDNPVLSQIIEAALLAYNKPLSIAKLRNLFEANAQPEAAEIKAVLQALQADYENRGVQLVEVASGWRFQVKEDLAAWVNRLWDEKPPRYSKAFLETLSLIAYRQPITRGEIENIRGVAVSSNIIKTMLEREWIRVLGHKEVPGRPAMYGTTKQFLDYFNLKSLSQLPSLMELQDLGFAIDETAEDATPASEAPDYQNLIAETENDAQEESESGIEDIPTENKTENNKPQLTVVQGKTEAE